MNSRRSPAEDPELDARIDAALQRGHRPPSAAAITARALGQAETTQRSPFDAVPLWARAATAVAAAALVTVLFASRAAADPVDPRVAEWITQYDEVQAAQNAIADAPAVDAMPFTTRCHEAFARVMNISKDAAVKICGDCCGSDCGEAVSLTAKCGDETVCVFVLLREAAPEIGRSLREGLRIHRRDIGNLSAFEVSSLSEPTVLPHLVSTQANE